MIAGQIVTMAPDGKLEHFPVVGYVVVAATRDRDVHHVEGEAGNRAARAFDAPGCCVSYRAGARSPAGSADDDFADLDDGSQIGVVRNVCHDLIRMRTESCLEGLDGIAENVAHADVGRG